MVQGVAARSPAATAVPSPPPPVLLLPSLPSSSHTVDWLADWTRTAGARLQGYQLWAVEQRVTDRGAILPVIVVFTGDKSDSISVDRFTLPNTLSYTQQAHRWEETRSLLRSTGAKVGEIRDEPDSHVPITSLPSLDPNLSIVHLPEGDFPAVMQLLYANINLRRLGLGGRSGLRLTPATPAQQLHFRQSFRLPIPAPSTHFHSSTAPSAFVGAGSSSNGHGPPTNLSPNAPTPFTETILAVIKLVQHALSLFGLGIVRVPLDGGQAGSLLAPAAGSFDMEEWSEAMAHSIDSSRHLTTGDGLLCDTTLAALSLFRFEFAEPLVHLPQGEEAVLSSSLLAALLSIVVGARGKMSALGEETPKDPFERRAKFLLAVQGFAKHHRLEPAHYLTRTFLSSLSTLYSRSRHPDGTRTKVSRAVRARLDAGLSSLVSPDGSAQGGATLRRAKGEEVEGTSLEGLVGEMAKGVGGGTLGRLWGMREEKEGRRERRRLSRERARGREKEGQKTDGDVTEAEKGAATGSDGESLAPSAHAAAGAGEGVLGLGKGVLRGVRERAGRAGRLFGDGLGFTEAQAHPQTHPAPPTSTAKVTPALVISPDPADSRSSTLEPESATSSKAAAFAARVASALSSSETPQTSSTSSLRKPRGSSSVGRGEGLSPSPSISPRASLSVSPGARPPTEWETDARMPSPRRSISEAPGLATLSRLSGDKVVEEDEEEGDGGDHMGLGMSDMRLAASHGGEERRPGIGRRRRHSFNVVQDAPEPWQVLSRKRLVVDVNLRMTYWTLMQKERKLAEMAEALRTVSNSYDQALASLEPLLASKTTHLEHLTAGALSLSHHADSYAASTSPLSKLSIGSSRLLYAQSVVEEKLGDVTDFAGMVQSKVGVGGTLDKGTRELGGQRMGVRKLVKSVERWRVWLGYLGKRAVWHVGVGNGGLEEVQQ